MPIFGGRSYNGMTALQILQELKLTTGLQLCLDAGDSASYTSGQKWLDRSGNGYDFNRGVQTSSAVAITGTANSTMSAATSLVGVAIGAAAASRMVVVCLTYRDATDPTSLTIGGIAATQLVGPTSEGEDNRTAVIWAAMVPTGTTATVAWTNAIEGGYSIFSVTGVAAVTAHGTLSDATDPMSGTINIPANGGMIAVTNKTAGGTGVTWSGATEYSDFTEAGGSPDRHSAASRTTVAAETGHTVAVTSDFSVMLAVSWVPDPAGGAFTNEPTFNGTPGGLSSAEYFSFDSDYFEYDSANETWMNNLHKDNATASGLFWVYFAALPSVTGDRHTIMSTLVAAVSETGMRFLSPPENDRLQIEVRNLGSFGVQLTSGPLLAVTLGWNCIAFSIDESVGALGCLMRNGDRTSSHTSTYTTPASADATNRMRLGGAEVLIGSGTRFGMMAVWSAALTNAQLSAAFNATRGRYGV